MLKTWRLVCGSLVVIGAQAWASRPCLDLLTVSEPRTQFAYAELSAASDWLQTLVGGSKPQGFSQFLNGQGLNEWSLTEAQRDTQLARFALNQWDQWRRVNQVQREHALALELRKLSATPDEPATLVSLDGGVQLTRLSAQNLKRMTARLNELYPLTAAIEQDESLRRKIELMARSLSFHYLRDYRPKRETGVHGPLPAQRELQKLRMKEPWDFYSALVDGSPSVEFTMVATESTRDLRYLGARVANDAVRLNSEFAQNEGFSLPQIKNALEIIKLFAFWEPTALDELLRDLRFSLPNAISSVQDLRRYLTPGALLQTTFPEEALYQRMAALRTRLNQFVLSEPDTQTFLRETFTHFMLDQANHGYERFRAFEAKFHQPHGAQEMMSTDVMDYLAYSGLSLRIPVMASNYTIVRREASPGARHGTDFQKPWDSRRLDHDSRP